MDTKELLQKIRTLEIKTKHLTKEMLSGEYHAAFKGRGMTFSEVRNYHVGDEIRTIDWNVTARFNEPFVKVFEEERELNVFLLVDVSKSMDFGTDKSKRELALELSAVLSFSGLQNNDKIGALFFSDGIERYVAPRKGRKQVLAILSELIQQEVKGQGTNLSEALKMVNQVSKKRSVIFVMSDFIQSEGVAEQLARMKRKHDVVALHVYHPQEKVHPKIGWTQVQNLESGKKHWANTSSQKFQKNYRDLYEQRLNTLQTEWKSYGIDHVSLSTRDDFYPVLVNLFHSRA